MNSPEGTFVAHVKAGKVQLPPPLARFCEEAKWTLFRINPLDEARLEFLPILPDDKEDDVESGFHSSLSADGKLWIPVELREAVTLGDQAVMVRVEEGTIRMYLRQVFKTLGFRP